MPEVGGSSDLVPQTKDLLRRLCVDAVGWVAQAGVRPSSYRRLSPFNDPRRNESFISLSTFAPASAALHAVPHFDERIGARAADNFALQFVFNFLGRLRRPIFDEALFDVVWDELTTELADPDWTYLCVCNLKNLTCPEDSIALGDGVLVHSRDYAALSALLGKDEAYIDSTLGHDWMEGHGGTHVMIAEARLAKAPENLVQSNDVTSLAKLHRAILAMRLVKPGFVTPGRIFFLRKARFRFGLDAIMSSGLSRWNFGTESDLAARDVPAVQAMCAALEALDAMGSDTRSLKLALRAFSSIYDRESFRAEDRLVDSVTAIEAALRLDTDLSFRSSFQVAGLLASDDDERITIFRDMRTFYDARSKVVHGGILKSKHIDALQNYERLVDLVRRLLAGFVRATAAAAFPKKFYEEIDAALQHPVQRAALRAPFGWT
jgi:hypothetical protein